VLAAGQRLRRADDFTTTVRTGQRASRDGLVVHLHVRAAGNGQRAGFVIPKAVGPAVTRNRVRRRLRHLLSAQLPTLAAGTDVVVRVQPAAAECTFEQLGLHLTDALRAAVRKSQTPRRAAALAAAGKGREGRHD